MYVCGLGDVVALFLEERKADTLLRLRGARSRFRTGGIPFGVLLITKLAGVGKLLRLRGARNHFQKGSIFFLSKFS